jgi:hypothetical protein
MSTEDARPPAMPSLRSLGGIRRAVTVSSESLVRFGSLPIRAPYSGAREILVGMAEPVSEDQIQR